jgi:hypothetical protein
MSSIDKLALTCRLLYDQRVLEQRKEIEMLEVKLFFKDYIDLDKSLKELNFQNIRCKCKGCKSAGRISFFDKVDIEAACTFGPWFDNVLHERGFVVLREDDWMDEWCEGPYDNVNENFETAPFTDDDCHLVERFSCMSESHHRGERWGCICIGKRLWAVESINNQWIKQFERVFGKYNLRLSSPPTPPPSPKMMPQPPPQ